MDLENQWHEAFYLYGYEFDKSRPYQYKTIDERTQLIGSLMKLEMDMYNGGFIQFFCNWGYEAYLLAVRGLEEIKAITAKSLLIESFSIIDKYDGDGRIQELWDIPSVLSADEIERLGKIDMEYSKDEANIREKMLSHFKN